MLPLLTLNDLKREAQTFCASLSLLAVPSLYGVTDGKAVGTFVEHGFREYLATKYAFEPGSSASGIDFPQSDLMVDLKVTSIRQPQSSSPFRDAAQKVYGLGYHLLLMVYDKFDVPEERSAKLSILHVVFIHKDYTADYQTTFGLREILRRNGNQDDIVAFLEDRYLPLDEPGRVALAQRILDHPPELGYLTISNALQWRLQYKRAIDLSAPGSGELDRLL
jgi:restriction system protein